MCSVLKSLGRSRKLCPQAGMRKSGLSLSTGSLLPDSCGRRVYILWLKALYGYLYPKMFIFLYEVIAKMGPQTDINVEQDPRLTGQPDNGFP